MVSVTQVLAQFPELELVQWQLRDPKKAKQVSEEAKRIGSVTDQLIQEDCRGKVVIPPGNTTPEMACWQGWLKFKIDHPDFLPSITGIQQELVVGDYVGHPDFRLLHMPANRHGICDLKCASQIRPSHWTQVAAYSWLWNPESNVDFLAILRLDKTTGSYEYVELTSPDEIDYEVQIWLNYKALYEHRQRVAERSRTMREDAVLYEP